MFTARELELIENSLEYMVSNLKEFGVTDLAEMQGLIKKVKEIEI